MAPRRRILSSFTLLFHPPLSSHKDARPCLTDPQGIPLLKSAWDAGITTIDTANVYSNGQSERVIGRFIKTHSIPRQSLVLMTKVYAFTPDDPSVFTMLHPELADTREFVNQGGLSRAAIFNQVDACLARLGTAYIDVLQIHTFDPATPMEETMRALHDLVARGTVRYLGASNLRAWQLAEMNGIAEKRGWTPFSCVQVEHSLLSRSQEAEMFEYCKYKGLGILPYAPLMKGHLARPFGADTPRTKSVEDTFLEKSFTESEKTIIGRVEELARKHSLNMAQIALAWSASKTTSPIVGANTAERLLDCIIAENVLTEDDVKYLEEP
ncbi:NADP-dependent oxidoreductase domain-containing protein [Amylostereum chailletii]|nr:NADP-dependent oxidoreductase domain-containing protein [Amylostereum chailletii]